MSNLTDLYQEIILKHNKNPENFHKNENAQHTIKAYNPICGDHYHIYLDINNKMISNISFHGYGCAISKASSSIMTVKLIGTSTDEAYDVYNEFQKVIDPRLNNINPDITDKEFLAFSAAKDHPSRLKCVTLSWVNLIDYLRKI